MLQFLLVFVAAWFILVLIAALLYAMGLVSVVDAMDQLARKLGLSSPSPETRVVGQEHVGRVTRRFILDEGAGCWLGTVFVNGETWNAECAADLAQELKDGSRVRVVYEENLRVRVLGKA